MLLPLFGFSQRGNFLFNQHSSNAVDIGDSVLVIQICNSNFAKDDNFNIFLNNVYIGFVDLNFNDYSGSLFQGTAKTDYIIDGDFDCPIIDMVDYFFNSSVLIEGQNQIIMKNTEAHKNGNHGSIGVRHYKISATKDSLINPRAVADMIFKIPNGENDTLYFTYP